MRTILATTWVPVPQGTSGSLDCRTQEGVLWGTYQWGPKAMSHSCSFSCSRQALKSSRPFPAGSGGLEGTERIEHGKMWE
ncbi:hypothetical protein BDN70DRAFT_647870 [Pholiota conissans]|uniref:Uncharacterized protein n=1 Tax=Pholiota conissans TaxID=109636 RepID=A0A9P5YJ51_9AGAR|nr:hypothetical protein BDN70DRAFT_647870 [Pholiota conissans]